MFGAIAWGALCRPLGLLHFLVCATRVLQWGSQKLQKHLKLNGLGRFWRTLLGTPIWTMRRRKAFPCSVALVLHFPEALPCSAALVFRFLIMGGPTWPSEDVRTIYKPNAILHILEKHENGRCPQKWIRETNIFKIRRKNEYLE